MKSGTEKRPNPHEPTLTKFLRSLSRPVSKGYVRLRNGQILRQETFDYWKFMATR